MDAEQLLETTMDPKNRKMLRVTLNDAIKAEQVFTDLMGDDVDPRKEFIHANAKFVKNLDAGEHTFNIYAKEIDYKIGLICVSNIETLDDFKEEVKNLDLNTVTTGIGQLQNGQVNSCRYFTVDGRQTSTMTKGVNIVKETLSNGAVRTKKLIVE